MTALRILIAIGCLIAATGCDQVFGLDRPDPPPPPPPEWIALTAGSSHTCGVKVDQTLWCWGENGRGETGLPDTTEEITTPTKVGDDRWATVASHFHHSCAIDTAGVLWCWGQNFDRAIGVASSADHLPLTRVLDDTTAVATGDSHTCAIRGDQTLWCWGRNSEAELGLPPSTTESPHPITGDLRWTKVAAGNYHTCGLTTDGALMCWGDNTYGQVLVGGGIRYSDPQPIEPGTTWIDLAVGQYHTCGVRRDFTLHCFGFNHLGQLGSAVQTGMGGDVATGEPARTWTRVFAAVHHTCALRDDKTLWCFGDNSKGKLALVGVEYATRPTQVTGAGETWSEIAMGGSHLCGVDSTGVMWCAGNNGAGQVGDGTGGSRPSPSQAAGTWSSVAANSSTTCARDKLGALWCWGRNSNGQIGDGTYFARQTPVRISAGRTTDPFAIGASHTCATKSATDHTLMCWGNNTNGQLGIGSSGDAKALPQPTSIIDPTDLSAGTQTCALSGGAVGDLQCWGSNSQAQLAFTADIAPHPLPIPIPQTPWHAVAAGAIHTCGRRNTSLYCWGDNSSLQRGTTVTPGVGMVSTTTKSVVLGSFHSCVITTADQLECWGRNNDGQVGNATLTNQAVPQPIGGALWDAIALGMRHTCGLQRDGSLWCWGSNSRGQLGNASRTDEIAPTRIGTDTSWRSLGAGSDATCAIKNDDSLWCWGANDDGQIGDGSAWSPAFVRIPP